MANRKETVSLVLGSGGARGLAHIGVIRCLEKKGYKIESISGCSMGALVGGVYAAGKMDDYESWVKGIDKFDIFNLLDFSFGRTGLVKGEKLMEKLKEMIGDRKIEDLPIAFTSVASDIVREREVWFSKGSLYDAIRASISLPVFFTPYQVNGVKLLDGGIFNPVPIAPTYNDMTDLTIAVNLIGPHDKEYESRTKDDKADQEDDAGGFRKILGDFMARFSPIDPGDSEEWDYFFIAGQSFDAIQGVIARQKLAAHPPDVVIEIPRNACTILEFDRAREMIELGYQKAEKALADLQAGG